MGFAGVDQTLGSGFPNQERRLFSINKGLLNTLWWTGLAMTAAIIGVSVFIFLLQPPDEVQDFVAKVVPFEPGFPEKVEQPYIPTETTPKQEEAKNNPVLPEVKTKPPVRISSDRKKTKLGIVEKNRKEEIVSPATPPGVMQPPENPRVRFVNILASMDIQDNNLLNNAFEKMKSNLFYAWVNRLNGYSYEVVLRPAYTNKYGAPCRMAILRSWQGLQSRNTIYKQQNISACRMFQHPKWYIR